MIPGDDTSGGDDHEVDRLLRAAASKADSIDWALSADDVSDRLRAGPSGPRHRAVAAGLLMAAVIVAIFVAPIPQLHLFQHESPTTIVSGHGPFPALTCPRSRPVSSVSWVPADAHGVDGSARLVPETTPSHAVICAYGGSKLAVLVGFKSITKGRPALASELTWLPRPERTACGGVGLGGVGGRDPTPAAYLIGLSYRQGWLWVSTAYTGDCDGASNGTFATLGGDRGRDQEGLRDRAMGGSQLIFLRVTRVWPPGPGARHGARDTGLARYLLLQGRSTVSRDAGLDVSYAAHAASRAPQSTTDVHVDRELP